MISKRLVLLSGGLDSTVALAQAVSDLRSSNVMALSFLYNQRHKQELDCAVFQSNKYNVSHLFKDISGLYSNKTENPLLNHNKDIPQGEYKANEVPSTYVPFRNGILLSIATAVAYEQGFNTVTIAAHGMSDGDAAYPDCTPDFITDISLAIHSGTNGKVSLYAPFIKMTKAEIVKTGLFLDVDFTHTWSCYRGEEKPCGVCATCIERRQAFEKNGCTPR